jgi:hypothetical protein
MDAAREGVVTQRKNPTGWWGGVGSKVKKS